jgi:hypothetical protein
MRYRKRPDAEERPRRKLKPKTEPAEERPRRKLKPKTEPAEERPLRKLKPKTELADAVVAEPAAQPAAQPVTQQQQSSSSPLNEARKISMANLLAAASSR